MNEVLIWINAFTCSMHFVYLSFEFLIFFYNIQTAEGKYPTQNKYLVDAGRNFQILHIFWPLVNYPRNRDFEVNQEILLKTVFYPLLKLITSKIFPTKVYP